MNENNVERIQLNPLKSSIYLGIPIIFLILLDTVFQVSDAYWMNNLGNAAIISLGYITNFTYVMYKLGDGIGRASNVLISMEFGAKNYEMINNIAAHGMILCLICSIIFPLVTLPLIKPLCAMADIGEYGDLIFSYLLLPTVFIILSIGCAYFSSLMGSEGDTKRPTIIMITGNTVNFLLDPILIFKMNLGIFGAGLSTAIGFFISFALFIYLFYIKSDTIVKINYSYFKADSKIFIKIIKLAIPIIIESIIIAFIGILINYALYLYAPPTSAYAYIIIFRVQLVFLTPVYGLSRGFYTVIGHLFGAKRFETMKDTIKKFILITLSIALFISILLIIFHEPFTLFFTTEYAVMSEVKNMLIFIILMTILLSIISPISYAFLGIGESQYMLYFIIYNLILFQIFLFIFNNILNLGAFGVFLATTIAYVIETVTMSYVLNRHINQYANASSN